MGNSTITKLKNIQPKRASLPELAAEQIRALIADRKLSAGDKMPNEMELCMQLNIGRSTVREAIKLLVSRNVLEIRRGVGTFIADSTGIVEDPFGFEFFEDKNKLPWELYEARLLMEPGIAALAAKHATEEEILHLRELQKEVELAFARGENHLDADKSLHIAIAACTGNRVLPLFIPVITWSVYLMGERIKKELAKETIETHAAIVDAIAAHDETQAAAAMEKHLRQNEKYVK